MSTIGGKLTSLPTATRSGSYSFDGWYTAASGGTQITTAYTFSANTTVYAHWTYTGGGGGSYYAPVVPDMPMVYWGCTGDAVKTLQEKLNAKGFNSGNVDGIFGAKTYAAATAFQKANGLGVDGIVGKLTWAKLYDATPVNVTPVTTQPMLRTGSRGDAVRKLQELLNAKGYTCGSVDGIFRSKCMGMLEAVGEVFPDAKYQRCTVHFYRNVFSVVPKSKVKIVAKMLKAIHAQESKKASREKAKAVVAELRAMKLKEAAKKVEDGIEETLTYCDFPSEHWTRIRTNNVIERLNREIRRRTRVVGTFPDGNSALMLVCARLRHVAGTQWGNKKYMNMKHLEAALDDASIAG